MKKVILLLLVAVSATVALSSCGSKASQTNDIFILIDNTDGIKYKNELISTDWIAEKVDLKGTVRWKTLTGVSINEEAAIRLEVPDGATNVMKADQVDPFVRGLDSLKKKFLHGTSESKTSSLWVPICQALRMLDASATIEPGERTLIVVSDMVENSQYGNFYKDQPYEKAKALLASSRDSLPRSPKVKVIILYNPEQNLQKEILHKNVMEKYWIPLFQEAGIAYEERANLDKIH